MGDADDPSRIASIDRPAGPPETNAIRRTLLGVEVAVTMTIPSMSG